MRLEGSSPLLQWGERDFPTVAPEQMQEDPEEVVRSEPAAVPLSTKLEAGIHTG